MTNQAITFNSLDSYFLNTTNNTLNIGYVNDQIYTQFDIVWRNEREYNGKSRLYNALINKRRKVSSLVWEAFIDFTNTAIRQEYGDKYEASSQQLKNYLKKYGKSFDALQPVIDEVEHMRRDFLAEQESA